MITVKNNSRTTYYHSEKVKDAEGKTKLKNYVVGAFGIAEVPEHVAKIWFKTKNIVEYVKPEEAKEQQAKLEKAKAELEAENAKLKAELEALKKAKTADTAKGNTENQALDIEALKKEAADLGIQFAPNIGAEKLKAKIEAKKAEQQ